MSNTGIQQAITLIGGFGAGAALMYILDPDKGRRRRALARDKLLHSVKETESALGKASRDLGNRTRGMLARAESRFRHAFVPDEVLQARVRAQMGHVISHPHAISVSASDGRVSLRGPVLAREVERLLDSVLSVPGVSEIEDQLEVYTEPGHVPGLQGGRARRNRAGLLTRECSPAEQLIGVVTGSALMIYGLSRRGVPGAALGLIGAGAMLYSALNGQRDQRQDADRQPSLQPFNHNQSRKEKTMADQYRNYGDRNYGGSRYGRRYDEEDERYNRWREEDRGFMNRAGDEVRSWFGDEEAERRRRRDEMEDERRYGREGYGTFDRFSGREEERHGYGRERGREYGREGYSGGYGYGRESGYGPARGYRSEEYGASESERGMSGRDYGRERRGSYGSSYGEGGYTSGMDYGRYGTSGREYEAERGYSSSPSSWSYTEMWWVPGPFTGRGPSGWQRSDERITDDVSERLQQHGQIDASNITVSVNNGEVTLSGTVNSRLEKRLAEDIAEGCSGVKEVHNNLRVMKEQNQQLTSSTSQSTQQTQTGQQSSQRTRSTTS